MYRFIFSMIVALALAAVMSALFASPASAQCRAGACRDQFGQRVQARRESRPVLKVLSKARPKNWGK